MSANPTDDERLMVRPKRAWEILRISKSHGFSLLKRGVLERRQIGKRAVAVTIESIRAFADGRSPPESPAPGAPQPQPDRPVIKRPQGSAPRRVSRGVRR